MYELDQKWMTPFRMGTTSSITMQRLGTIVQRAPAVGAKMWCLSLCENADVSRSESRAPCVRGVHSSNKHCVAVYRPIWTRFSAFLKKVNHCALFLKLIDRHTPVMSHSPPTYVLEFSYAHIQLVHTLISTFLS